MPVHCAPPYGSIQRVTHTHTRHQQAEGSATVESAYRTSSAPRVMSWPQTPPRTHACYSHRVAAFFGLSGPGT
eukprot:3470096-Prymnesium_polylepis.1